MPRINQVLVSNTLISMCNQKEQQEIVRRLEAKCVLCDQLEAQINASTHNAETLSSAILQELFDQNGGDD